MAENSTERISLAGRYLAAMAFRDYRWVWLAAFSGSSAHWALIVARGVLVHEMTGSSTLVGLATFAAMAPRFIVPPLAGFLADRFNRRDVVLAAFVLNLGHNVVLSVLALTGVLEVWQLLALSLFNGAVRTFQLTSTAALVPNVVPREHLLNAVSLNAATMQGSRLIGPGLMAPVLLLLGTEAAFAASTIFYAAGLIGIARVDVRSTGGLGQGAGLRQGIVEAFVFVWHDPKLRPIFILVSLHCAFTMSFESILPALARQTLGSTGGGVSSMMMAVGAGGLISVVLIAGIRSHPMRGRVLVASGVLSGVSLVAMGLATDVVTASVAAVAVGASQAGFMALVGAMVQSLSPDAMRGRISGLNQINIGGQMAVVNLGNGIVADITGPTAILLVLGLGFVAVMIASLLVVSLRRIYAGSMEPEAAPAAAG